MTIDGSFKAYSAKTEELRLQHAGLEIVLRMRSAIEQEAKESVLRGRPPHDLELHIANGNTPMVRHRGQELERLLANKSLIEQKQMIETLLRPYAQRGYIPNFHVSDAKFVSESLPHAVVKYDFTM